MQTLFKKNILLAATLALIAPYTCYSLSSFQPITYLIKNKTHTAITFIANVYDRTGNHKVEIKVAPDSNEYNDYDVTYNDLYGDPYVSHMIQVAGKEKSCEPSYQDLDPKEDHSFTVTIENWGQDPVCVVKED